MVAVITFILILSLLVFVHELGHFLTAKRAGITVEEFAIGFPPRALTLWQDEGWITLSGQRFMIGRRTRVPPRLQKGDYVSTETRLRPDGRHEISRITWHDPKTLDQVDTQSLDLVESLERPTEYTLNWIPFGGYVRMVGEEDPNAQGSFASKSKTARLVVLFAGAGMNLITAIIVFTLMFATGTPEPILEEVAHISGIAENSPAQQAGLQAGDVVIAADGQPIANATDLVTFITDRAGQEINLTIQRGEETIPLSVTPRVNPPPGEGAVGIAVGPRIIGQQITRYPLVESVWLGTRATTAIVIQTFTLPVAIARNIIPAEQARPIGPVGIYTLTESAVDESIETGFWYPLLFLTAVLSAALAITNLLPLPALDGGRIFFILIEAIRGKRISPEKEGAIHFVGLALLLTLMVVVSYYDVSNPIEIPSWSDLF